MTFYVFPYKPGSAGARSLAQGLGTTTLRHENSRYRYRRDRMIINWGFSGRFPTEAIERTPILNVPTVVRRISNKLRFFNLIQNQPVETRARMPEFTTQQTEVVNWLNEGHCVVARNVLNGHSGAGISLLNNADDLNSLNALTGGTTPLFVKYVKKRAEFRIHFMRRNWNSDCEVIDTQKKGLRGDQPRDEVNFQIRNHHNGYVYIREGFMVPPDVIRQAELAFRASGLNFGAVDVIWNERNAQAWVLEINCAPGLTGTTITNYVEGFRRLFPQ